MKKKHILLAFILLSSLFFCKKKDVKIPSMGFEYFPTEIGHFIIYQVDSIVYDDFFDPVKIDTFSFLIKEKIDADLENNANKKTQRIVRYVKWNDTTNWDVKNAVTHYITNTTAERIENNQHFIKLIFPPSENKTWNGNAYNNLPEQKYKYIEVNQKSEIGTILFDTTLSVVQIDDENLIEKTYSEEKYATGVGLIYKKNTLIKTDINGNIKSGTDITYTVIDFGKE